MIRVIVADDHHLVRQGIRMLLESSEDIEVVGEAEDGMAACALAESLTPDIIVMDISMPRLNGAQATEQIRSHLPETQVVVLSMHADESVVKRALRSGARAYVLKRAVSEELLLAIRAANRGETYLSPPIAGSILTDFLATAGRHRGDWCTATFDAQGAAGAATPRRRQHQRQDRRHPGRHREDGGEASRQRDE